MVIRKNIFPSIHCAHKPLLQTRGRKITLSLLCAMLLMVDVQAASSAEKNFSKQRDILISEEINPYDYSPDKLNTLLIPLSGDPTVIIDKEWPRLDGATACYPLYAAMAYGLYRGVELKSGYDYLASSRTSVAYEKLIDGEVDVIFVAQPSKQQIMLAESKNVKLNYTPFAREAFVFIANRNNSVHNLSQQQIQDIYSGKITNWKSISGWKKIFGNYRSIIAWQRPENSGSQTTMLAEVMKGIPMIPPKETVTKQFMQGVVREVADYQNAPGSLGYTFRYFATKMVSDTTAIQLLAVDGVEPNIRTIRDGSYPFVVDVYMVTREQTTPNTRKLVNWFLSPQGQRLVQDVGYVPLLPSSN